MLCRHYRTQFGNFQFDGIIKQIHAISPGTCHFESPVAQLALATGWRGAFAEQGLTRQELKPWSLTIKPMPTSMPRGLAQKNLGFMNRASRLRASNFQQVLVRGPGSSQCPYTGDLLLSWKMLRIAQHC